MSLLLPARRTKPGINIVPLIDVLIVLIFFILMTMQFRNISTLDITPPKMETAGNDTAAIESISVAINPAGNLFLNDVLITEKDLEDFLMKAGETNKQQSVLVLADKETALKYMTTVMDVSRKAGLEKVRLQVQGQ